jgi:hypothetical protein
MFGLPRFLNALSYLTAAHSFLARENHSSAMLTEWSLTVAGALHKKVRLRGDAGYSH